jgi:hypothetical protein
MLRSAAFGRLGTGPSSLLLPLPLPLPLPPLPRLLSVLLSPGCVRVELLLLVLLLVGVVVVVAVVVLGRSRGLVAAPFPRLNRVCFLAPVSVALAALFGRILCIFLSTRLCYAMLHDATPYDAIRRRACGVCLH